jgi:hypothetical protein
MRRVSRLTIKLFSLFAFGTALVGLVSCQGMRSGPTAGERGVEATSSVALTVEPTKTDQGAPMVKQLRRVDTGGNCAPRYKHGGIGACVNNVPCRGFGALDDKGRVICTCYGDIGGCGEGQRCDEKKLTCVADAEPPFNRAP